MTTVDEQAWVITDPQHTVIYGMVYASSASCALLAVINDPMQTLFGGERDESEVDAVRPQVLADERWREMAPLGASSQGDNGGDVQVTDSFSRRFAMIRPDDTWAVITYSWYGIAEGVEVTAETEAQVVEQQIEFLIVDDPRDLDYTIWWNDSYEKEYDPEPTEEGVRKRAEEFAVKDIEWDGEQFR